MTITEVVMAFGALMTPLAGLAAYIANSYKKREKDLEEALKKSEAENRELKALFIVHVSENREAREEIARLVGGRR